MQKHWWVVCTVLLACSNSSGVETTTTGSGTQIDDCEFGGTWTTVSGSCGVGPFDVTSANTSSIRVSSFGENSSVNFTAQAGTTNVFEADDLQILGAPAHHCELSITCSSTVPAIEVSCTNEQGGSCTELMTLAP